MTINFDPRSVFACYLQGTYLATRKLSFSCTGARPTRCPPSSLKRLAPSPTNRTAESCSPSKPVPPFCPTSSQGGRPALRSPSEGSLSPAQPSGGIARKACPKILLPSKYLLLPASSQEATARQAKGRQPLSRSTKRWAWLAKPARGSCSPSKYPLLLAKQSRGDLPIARRAKGRQPLSRSARRLGIARKACPKILLAEQVPPSAR